MKVPSSSHATPPYVVAAESATVTTTPVVIRTFLSCWSAVKAIHSPSGEKVGELARSVPGTATGSSVPARLSQRRAFWLLPRMTRVAPSGERANAGDVRVGARRSPNEIYSQLVRPDPLIPERDHPQMAA